MPGYSNYRIAELQQLCAQRRIAYAGLRKRDLIRLLIDDNECCLCNHNSDRNADDDRYDDNDVHERHGANNDVENASDDDDNDNEYYNDADEGSDDRSDFGDAEDAMPGESNPEEDAAQRDGNVGATAGVNQPAGGIGNTLTVGTEKPGDFRLTIQLERERRETKRVYI